VNKREHKGHMPLKSHTSTHQSLDPMKKNGCKCFSLSPEPSQVLGGANRFCKSLLIIVNNNNNSNLLIMTIKIQFCFVAQQF